MGRYGALFAAGFRRQSTYRAALLTGLGANVFFGVFRSAVFVALFRQRGEAGGLDVVEALTYVWVLQVVIGSVFASWIWEHPESIRAGDVVVDLLRPGDPLARMMAADLGRASFVLLARGLPQLVLSGLFFDLRLPTTVPGIAALGLALVLSAVAGFELRTAFGVLAYWTPDFRGWWNLLFGGLWLSAGFVVPVQMFPPAARWVAEHGPLTALLNVPVRVAIGQDVGQALALQLGWVVVGAVGCRAVLGVAHRRLVVHGG